MNRQSADYGQVTQAHMQRPQTSIERPALSGEGLDGFFELRFWERR
jgi:hypothetical protein